MKPRPTVAIAWTLAAVVLLLVFVAYGRPDFLMAISSQIWGCF